MYFAKGGHIFCNMHLCYLFRQSKVQLEEEGGLLTYYIHKIDQICGNYAVVRLSGYYFGYTAEENDASKFVEIKQNYSCFQIIQFCKFRGLLLIFCAIYHVYMMEGCV